MNLKFSLRRLLFVTTAIAVILAICDWMGIFKGTNTMAAAIGLYCLVYGGWFGIFFVPRYHREWKEFRLKRKQLKLTRQTLEAQTQKALNSPEDPATDSDGPQVADVIRTSESN